MDTILTTSLLVLCAVSGCYSYGNGAPNAACTNLAPIHGGVTPQTSDTYSITANSTTWSKSGVISVEISGGAVHGFILQAKQKTDGAGIGMFDEASLPAGAQMGPCTLNSQKISVTHKNQELKASTTFIWKAPTSTSYTGAIYFQGAVAVNKVTIWTNIKSSDIPIAASSAPDATTAPSPDNPTTQPHNNPTTQPPNASKPTTKPLVAELKSTAAPTTPVAKAERTTSGSGYMWMSATLLTLCSVAYAL